jgi:hypothetical protein
VSEGKLLVSEGKLLVSEGKPLVSEGKPLVPDGKPLVSEGKPLVPDGKPLVPEAKPRRLQVQARRLQAKADAREVHGASPPELASGPRAKVGLHRVEVVPPRPAPGDPRKGIAGRQDSGSPHGVPCPGPGAAMPDSLFTLDVTTDPAARRATLRLADVDGRHLAAHEVYLGKHPPASWAAAFDTRAHVKRMRRSAPAKEQLAKLGDFLGEHVLGPDIAGHLASGVRRPMRRRPRLTGRT